jgi:hypothetical protein
MDQAVSQHAKFDPALDGFYPSEFFSSLEVVELGPGTLKIDSQKNWQEFITQGILQSGKSGDKCLQHMNSPAPKRFAL